MTKTFQFLYKVVIPGVIAAIGFSSADFRDNPTTRTVWLVVSWCFTVWAVFNAIKYAVNWKGLGIFKKNP